MTVYTGNGWEVDTDAPSGYSGLATSVILKRPKNMLSGSRVSFTGVAAWESGGHVLRSAMGRKPKPSRIINGEQCWRCPSCERWLPRDAYSTEPRRPNGLDGRCKRCRRNLRRGRRNETLEHVRAQGRGYYRESGGREKARKYYRQNSLKCIAATRASDAKNPERRRARTAAYHARQSGLLLRPEKCSCCGRADLPIESHHPDYSKPLDVEWLCTVCHGRRHRA